MATFAKIGQNNIILDVVKVADKDTSDENDNQIESLGVTFLANLTGYAQWKKTSQNTFLNVHGLGGTPYRKNYAVIGGIYDEGRDAFIGPKQYDSWILNEETCGWEPPTPYPDDGQKYQWNESTKQWDLVAEIPQA